jgi:hypothetical protein
MTTDKAKTGKQMQDEKRKKILELRWKAKMEIDLNPDCETEGGTPIRPDRLVSVPAEMVMELTDDWLGFG